MGLFVLALGVLAPLCAAGFCVSRAGLVWVSQPLGGRLARQLTNPRSIWFGDVSQGRTEASNAQNIIPAGFQKCVFCAIHTHILACPGPC